MLTEEQLPILAAGIRAETDPICVNALSIGNAVALEKWVNSPSTQDAWNPEMSGKLLFEASDVAKFDNISAGKRDAWRLLLDFHPIDFARKKMRKAVADVWGADATSMLQACVRKATNGEKYLGGTDATEGSVTAWKLSVPGNIARTEIENAINRY